MTAVNPFAAEPVPDSRPRLTMSPDMPNHLLLTGHGRVVRVPIRVTDRGAVLFTTDFPGTVPDVEVLAANGEVMGAYPVRVVGHGPGAAKTYSLEVAR